MNCFKDQCGFSLVELMVALSVMTIVTLAALVSYSNFQDDVRLKNIAHEIAVSIRKAQVYGISTKEFSGGFDYSYGVHFDSNKKNSYILFVDLDGNDKYSPAESEAVKKFNLRSGFNISRVCGVTGGIKTCSPNFESMDIVFERITPDEDNPSAAVLIKNDRGEDYEKGEIYIRDPGGDAKVKININLTGQISVE